SLRCRVLAWLAGGGGNVRDEIRQALLDAAGTRPLMGGETSDLVEDTAVRIAELLATIEEPERGVLLDEALTKVAAPGTSLRKLEKRLRQAAIGAAGSARARAIVALAPEIQIDDLHGTVRFGVADEERVVIDGTTYAVPVVARLLGGALERSLLTRTAEEFVAEARPALAAQLDVARTEMREAAAAIEMIVRERVDRPLYDARALRRIVE